MIETTRMDLAELSQVIERSGGRSGALEYAEALLQKISRLEATGGYGQLFKQLSSSREQGDFRGRVLEVNFADLFQRNGQHLVYGARQGMTGDIDFLWRVDGLEVFIEMKLLRQDKASLDAMNLQLEAGGVYASHVTDDTRDIGRMQLDLISKAGTTKFNPQPQAGWINLVAIDVTELQLGMVDVADCVLAAAGNREVQHFYPDSPYTRPNVVGFFEKPAEATLTEEQRNWLTAMHRPNSAAPHPRDYLHGALFLFRHPKDTAALSYELNAVLVWNRLLVAHEKAVRIYEAMRPFLPYKPG